MHILGTAQERSYQTWQPVTQIAFAPSHTEGVRAADTDGLLEEATLRTLRTAQERRTTARAALVLDGEVVIIIVGATGYTMTRPAKRAERDAAIDFIGAR